MSLLSLYVPLCIFPCVSVKMSSCLLCWQRVVRTHSQPVSQSDSQPVSSLVSQSICLIVWLSDYMSVSLPVSLCPRTSLYVLVLWSDLMDFQLALFDPLWCSGRWATDVWLLNHKWENQKPIWTRTDSDTKYQNDMAICRSSKDHCSGGYWRYKSPTYLAEGTDKQDNTLYEYHFIWSNIKYFLANTNSAVILSVTS